MINQYAVKHEATEFLGPLRCQACVSRNCKCFVQEDSRYCFQCTSESVCVFTRTVERTTKKTGFSWEEMVGESPIPKPSQEDRHLPRSSNRSLLGRPEAFFPLHDYHQDSDPQVYTPLQFPEVYNDPHPIANQLQNPSTPAWIPLSPTSRRRYSSPARNYSDVSDSTLPRYRVSTRDAKKFPVLESFRRQDGASRGMPLSDTPLLMPSPNQLPSIRDTMPNMDPRLISPKPGTIRTWPLLNPNSNLSFVYTTEKTERSERPQSPVSSEISEPKSHDFVLETFNTSSGSMESRRGRRRGKLSQSSASSASKLRSIGACWKCKLQKNQVSEMNDNAAEFY